MNSRPIKLKYTKKKSDKSEKLIYFCKIPKLYQILHLKADFRFVPLFRQRIQMQLLFAAIHLCSQKINKEKSIKTTINPFFTSSFWFKCQRFFYLFLFCQNVIVFSMCITLFLFHSPLMLSNFHFQFFRQFLLKKIRNFNMYTCCWSHRAQHILNCTFIHFCLFPYYDRYGYLVLSGLFRQFQ